MVEVILAINLHKQRISGPRGTRSVTIGLDDITTGIHFRNQAFIGIDKICPNTVYFFPKPSTERIIVVGRFYYDKPFRPPERPFF